MIPCDRAKSGLGNQTELEEKVVNGISMELHHKDSRNQTTRV